MSKIKIKTNDMVGKRVGKLTVLSYAGCRYDYTKAGPKLRHFYKVKCDCGTIKTVRRNMLKNGLVKSCGCSRLGNKNGCKNAKQYR